MESKNVDKPGKFYTTTNPSLIEAKPDVKAEDQKV